jgi:glucose-6-phosphate isomerase
MSMFHIKLHNPSQGKLTMAEENCLQQLQRTMQQQAKIGPMQLKDLCLTAAELQKVKVLAKNIRQNFDQLLVLGTGGSALGAKTLLSLAGESAATKVEVCNDIEASVWQKRFQRYDPRRTAVLLVSKSGNTMETRLQIEVLLAHFFKDIPELQQAKHIWLLSQNQDSILLQQAKAKGWSYLEHPRNLCGRFSVFSAVGMLPAAVAGVAIEDIHQGALDCWNSVCTDAELRHSCFIAAQEMYAELQAKRNIQVMLAYGSQFRPFLDWYAQLTAESLGKDGKGFTPVAAHGPMDQHSLLQLWLAGPRQHFFTILSSDQKLSQPIEPFQQAMKMMSQGTAMALADRSAFVRSLNFADVNGKNLGYLLMHAMLETHFLAGLLKINAFDQPAVEDSKKWIRKAYAESAEL